MTYRMDATGNVSGEDLIINNELYGDVSKKPVLRARVFPLFSECDKGNRKRMHAGYTEKNRN